MFGVAAGGGLDQETPATLRSDLGADRAVGARWLRVDINWGEIQRDGPSSFQWGPIDAIVSGAEARGMNVLGVILYTPSWARPGGTSSSYAPNPNAYAAFAFEAVLHYEKLGVHAYEIWNEPNNPSFWQPHPSPAAYTTMLRTAYPVIKLADPSATVVTGGLSPAPSNGSSYSPVDFLSAIYANGGRGSFDAVGDHPYCWPAFPGQSYGWSAWYQMYGTSPSLRSVMAANGDGAKKIWATEFGAPTNGPAGSHVSDLQQAKMLVWAYRLFASYSWVGPLFFFQGRDQGTSTGTYENFFGFLKNNFSPKPSFTAYRQAASIL